MSGRSEKTATFEARIETQTAKAYLIIPTNTGKPIWLPKSQTYDRNEIGDGLWLFSVSQWWINKNPELFDE